MTADLLNSYEGRRVLVTGGASFIGSHLVELLLAAGADVRVADDLSSGKLEHLVTVIDDCEVRIGDCRDPEFSRECSAGAEIVFHLAASHGGRGYIETHPVECTNNMLLDQVVFAAAAQAGVAKIIHASSACAYPVALQQDANSRILLSEQDCNFEEPGKACADGEYGWAKLMGELQLRAFHKQFGLDAIACRLFTAYGERENESHAVVALIAKAVAHHDPYEIWGDGEQTRNFTYVRDTATGMALAGAVLEGFEVINVGSELHTKVNDLVEDIFDIVGFRPESIVHQRDMPVGVHSRAANCDKCRKVLGWFPDTSVRDGLERTIEWYRSTVSLERLEHLDALLMSR